MNITSTRTKNYQEWNCLEQRTTEWVVEIPNSELTQGIVKRCISYAEVRLANFPFDLSKITNVHVEKNHNDFITVSFKGKFGAIKVGGIMIGKGGWPTLDHGIYIDENDTV